MSLTRTILLLLDGHEAVAGLSASDSAWVAGLQEEWSGLPVVRCIHPDDYPVWEQVRRALRDGLPHDPLVCRFLRDNRWEPFVVVCGATAGTITTLILQEASAAPLSQIDRLSLALEQSPAAVMTTDASGRILYINRRFTEMSGYLPHEILGQTPGILKSGLTPEETYRDLWRTITSGEVWRGQLCNRRKDGGLYWHSSSISPVRDSGGVVTGWVAVQEDITEQLRMHQALVAKEAQYRRIVDTASEGIWQVDAAHRTTYVNERLAIMLGYQAEEMLGRPVFDFVDQEGRLLAEASLARRRQGIREQQEFKLMRRDGSVLWVLMSTGPILDEQGAYAGALAMVTDLTARRAAEATLRRSEAWFRTLIEGAEDLIAVLAADGTFRYASPSFERLLGFTPAELIGRKAIEFAHPEETEQVRSLFARSIAADQALQPMQYRFRHANGNWRLLDGIGRNLLRDPVVAGIVIHGRDVTDRTALEAQYRQAQKMEAVGRLVGGVAHDFNNLLAVILGASDILREDLSPGHPAMADVLEIRAAGERAADLTRQLLTFSRKQLVAPRLLDLNEVVAGVKKMLTRLLGEEVQLSAKLTDQPIMVKADPGQLEQVLMNLAVNSRDAMPEGGRLLIETDVVDIDRSYRARHNVMRLGPHALLAVSDTGCGMDELTRARVFEPFFTTKDPGKGTGLGLSTVYGIVKQSSGFIWVYSEPGRGTTFKIYLPLTSESGELTTLHLAETDTPQRGSETILVAEDNHEVREFVRRALERQGYTVVAGSDLECVELAASWSGPIHLLLTDVIMPNIRGPELARRVTGIRPGLPVLYMSGYTDHAAIDGKAIEDGAAYLQKPFTPSALTRKIREALDRPPEAPPAS